MGVPVSRTKAEQLLSTEKGQLLLAPENGAIAITEDLINLGRDSFYRETFGNEYFFTDVMGVLDFVYHRIYGRADRLLQSRQILTQPSTKLSVAFA